MDNSLEKIEKILSDSQAEKYLCVDDTQTRDPLRDKPYFQAYIQKSQERIRKFCRWLNEGEVNNVGFAKRKMFSLSLQSLIANYSMGKDIQLLKEEFLETIVYCQYGAKRKKYYFDEYVRMLWMLSLGILLEIENEQYQKIVDVLRESGVEDVLFEFLIRYKLSNGLEDTKNTFIDGISFQDLVQAIKMDASESERIESMNRFLQYWYRNMGYATWYETHKNDSINLYFGYWSFEAAAVVKILGLDKDTFEKQKYFPQDLM